MATPTSSSPLSSSASTGARSIAVPSARVLIGGVYAICVLGLLAVFTGQILFTDVDPHSSEGPIASIISVGVVGTAALVLGVGAGLWLVRTPDRAKTGAIGLAALSVITLIVFWSGAPGILGACAAWLAGLTRGQRQLGGAARIAGVVGIFIALLNVVLTVGGVLLSGVNG